MAFNTPIVDPWVMRPRPHPRACLRLFCFPYAGGGASVYRGWADALPPQFEVCPIQLPGRESRLAEPPFTRLSSLVEHLAAVLEPYLQLPFAFFGHSMGALIGFELARHLRRDGVCGPEHLFVSGHHAPQLPDPYPPIHHLPEAAFLRGLQRLNGTPEAVLQNSELMQLLLPMLRADLQLSETYCFTPEQPLNCPITAFGGSEDSNLTRRVLTPWQDQTQDTFTLHFFPGDHFFLHTARAALLQVISQECSRLMDGTTGGRSS